jgi:5-methylcytosine-specific restriction endonuclease McrA
MGKICTKCKQKKQTTEYYKHKNGRDGLNPVCKICWKKENKLFEENNPRQTYRKERYLKIKPEHNKKVRENSKKRYSNDIEYKLLTLTRGRIHNYLKGTHKSESTKAILGIDAEGYKQYLENLFVEGMSWDNHGEWEIDHIHPISKGGTFHYTNTQPLWKEENRKKSNKLGYLRYPPYIYIK